MSVSRFRLSLVAALIPVALAGCAPLVATRGNIVQDFRLDRIEPGKTSRTDVQGILGTPTATGTLDGSTWYYIGRRTEQTAFFEPDIAQQRIVRVTFGPDDIVQSIDDIDRSQERYIEPVDRRTPTAGRDITLLEQFLGNLNRQRPKKDDEEEGGGGRRR